MSDQSTDVGQGTTADPLHLSGSGPVGEPVTVGGDLDERHAPNYYPADVEAARQTADAAGQAAAEAAQGK